MSANVFRISVWYATWPTMMDAMQRNHFALKMLVASLSVSDAWPTTTAKMYLLHSVCKGIAHPVIHRPMKGVMNSHHSARCKSLERSAWAVEMQGIATNQANSNATRVNAKPVRSMAMMDAAETPHSVMAGRDGRKCGECTLDEHCNDPSFPVCSDGQCGVCQLFTNVAAVGIRRFAIREPTAPDADMSR